MKPQNRFTTGLLDLAAPEAVDDILFRAGKPRSVRERAGAVVFRVPFLAQKQSSLDLEPDKKVRPRMQDIVVRAYGDSIVRVTVAFAGKIPDDNSPMLDLHPSLKAVPLTVKRTTAGWEVRDPLNAIRFRVNTAKKPVKQWSRLLRPFGDTFDASVFPDGKTNVDFMAYDSFFKKCQDSIPLGYVERKRKPHRACWSLHALPDEKFAGTGERFAHMDLAGRTVDLYNTDGLGVNSRRTYKNVPFYVTSRPYGLFIHTTAHTRLSLADLSTRAAQGMLETPVLDLFFIGGESVERILYNYRCLTGFPPELPLWSYGTWMSRMTYFSEKETKEVARKLRQGDFPCDVIHLDTGWFDKDWVCDWTFNRKRFPDPERYMRDMRQQGFRVSLWQTPYQRPESPLFKDAAKKGYIALPLKNTSGASDFGVAKGILAPIDFTNPKGAAWYQEKIGVLLKLGAVVIKTDFGEDLYNGEKFHGLSAELLHNLYALLYQKTAFDITKKITGEGIIWARGGWAGCQRYPIHWGGDAACSWDGLAGSIRGGLHLGLSGFAYWSHDIPGFHGIHDFMNAMPPDDLYMRWTQFGVFTSHMRYHGAQPREPYEYQAIAPLVRKWWKLRYALIPYITDEASSCCRSGLPLLRALVFHHADDPACWHVDDQYYFGNAFLVAPVMNSKGTRDVYLPKGEWVDVWTGKTRSGPVLLKNVKSPLARVPLYAKRNARIRVYPHPVRCTDDMDLKKSVRLCFDGSYRGLTRSVLGRVTGL